MTGEIVRTLTQDGLELQGLLVKPETDDKGIGLLHIHGLAGNFYENRFIDAIADSVGKKGFWFLTVSTRGRDYISDFLCFLPDGRKEYVQVGSVHEMFEDCLEDIDAWIRFFQGRGIERIILEGHSHGAVKVTYYFCRKSNEALCGLILLSPSDDFGLQRKRLGENFDQALSLAKDMISRGEARSLMPSRYFDYPVSAATYYDIFRSDSPLKIFNLSRTDREDFFELATIKIPVLTVLGTENEAFIAPADQYLREIERSIGGSDFEARIIEGAPHNYLDYEDDVASTICDWLVRKFGYLR